MAHPTTHLPLPPPLLSPWLKEAFRDLIVARTGLTFKPQAQGTMDAKIMARVEALGYAFPEAYYQLLSEHSLSSHQEWQQLSELLTNGESFFFRDRGQFAALEHHILPELIQRNATEKKLRICSAGCATGEEIYSLVILLETLIPDLAQWDVRVYGVDLNPVSIAYAQAGIYRSWSLRGLSPAQKKTYFRQVDQQYHIDPRFKQWVRFQSLNLVNDPFTVSDDDAFGEGEIERFDLIVCRNVFIYFSSAAIAKVLDKFYQALCPLGYLLTGHSELYEQNLESFHIQNFPGSLAFQRPVHSLRAASADGTAAVTAQGGRANANGQHVLSPSARAFQHFQQAQSALKNKNFDEALAQSEQALTLQPTDLKTLGLRAQIYASLGDHDTAAHYCHAALKLDSSFMPPHYLLAKIFTAQNNLPAAKRILKKVIYLDPSAVVAYLELSQLYEQENNLKKSNLMRQAAFNIFSQHLSTPGQLNSDLLEATLSTADLITDTLLEEENPPAARSQAARSPEDLS